MKTSIFAAFAAVLAITAAGCAGTSKETAATEPIRGTVRETEISTTATVEAIDYQKRVVTLRGADGKLRKIVADERVKNLAQVKKGDLVSATYRESVAYEVKKPGKAQPGVSAAAVSSSAKPGEQPAGVAGQTVTITSTVEAIDRKAPSVTLRTADGESIPIRVRDPAKLEGVAVGDLLEITYTEALAISVEPAPKP